MPKSLKELTPDHHEPSWSKALAVELGGRAEERTLYGSRCDIVTEHYSIEVEKSANKWAEQIGQAIFYAVALGRKPGIILLVEDKDDEQVNIGRCAVACAYAKITFSWIRMDDPASQLDQLKTIFCPRALPSALAEESEVGHS